MKSSVVFNGPLKLQKAIEAEVRHELEKELSAATTRKQKAALKEKIRKEVKERMKQYASPYSLWNSALLGS
jgi:hypothetical protein